MDFNAKETVSTLKDVSDKVNKWNEKWESSKKELNQFQSFLFEHREIFKKTSTVLGFVSFGFSVAGALGAFGPSEHQQVMNKLDAIEKEIASLKNQMILEFDKLSKQISYEIKNQTITNAINVIASANEYRLQYLKYCEDKNSIGYINAKENFLKINRANIHSAIFSLYDSFLNLSKENNILELMYDHFCGSIQTLSSKGLEIITVVQEGIKVYGLSEGIDLEDKKNFSAEQINNQVDKQLNEEYTNKVNEMYDCLNKIVQKSYKNINGNLSDFYRKKLTNSLSKDKNAGNCTMLCSTFEYHFPMIDFMAIDYDNCKGDKQHLDSLRDSNSISDYHNGNINRNVLVWWQWHPKDETLKYSPSSILSDYIKPLSNMPESYQVGGDGSVIDKDDIKDVIKVKTKFGSLSSISVGSNALVVKKRYSPNFHWAHSSNCVIGNSQPRAQQFTGNNYHIFWFVLD